MKKLFLLDGHALVYRAHFAFIQRPLINSKGLNVSAISGFTRLLWDVIKNQSPTHIAVAFDLSGPTFRNEMYPEYKANREAQPEDIALAFPYIHQILDAFKIPIITKEGFEADDVIGTIAKQAEKEGFTVFMMTSDKDYAQLVSDNIYFYKPGRKGGEVEVMGVPEILKKWDIARVDQVIDILGLQGDAVDNIPGIPGIGAKTAVKLLKQYDSVEGLIENSDKLKGKQKEKVIEFAEQGLLSKKLATIDVNVDIQFDADDYIISPFDREALSTVFKELEFRGISKSILGHSSKPEDIQAGKSDNVQKDLFGNPVGHAGRVNFSAQISDYSVAENNLENSNQKYILVNTPESRKKLVADLLKEKVVCFDTETTGVDPNVAELVGMAFSAKAETGYYVPVPADRAEGIKIAAEFKPVLENDKIEIVGQNLKFDILMMKWYEVEINTPLFDTMIAHYLCEPDHRHKLDYLAETYLKYKMVPIESLIGKRGKNQLSMRDIEVEKVTDYAAEDADITLRLKAPLQALLKEIEADKLYRELEIPLIKVLADMEFEGVRVNADFLNEYSVELGEYIATEEKKIYKEASVNFNIASPKQVGEVLFDKLNLPYRWKKTASGQYSTNEEKLSELAEKFDIPRMILDYRKLAKLKSTYVDALPKLINPKTGRIHSSFNQARAATGRLSSDNPNLQNIPIRDEAGRKIRKAFEPRDENHVLLAADYSQIELRLIAEISQDEAMLDAFVNGHDIHQATAAGVFNKKLDEVTPDERRAAKTVNFAIIYGAGATNLSKQLNIPRKEATVLIENYFKQYKGLKKYMTETVEFAREHGYVLTLMGRRRYLRDINARNGLERSNSERIAINTPIQGTAADMIKVAMINIHRALKEGNFKTKMIMQVHDELVFDIPKEELEKVSPIIEDLMKNAMPQLKVPILVGMDTGKNWLEAH